MSVLNKKHNSVKIKTKHMFPLVWADQRGDGYLLVSCLKFKDDVIICGHELGLFICKAKCDYRLQAEDKLKERGKYEEHNKLLRQAL